MIECAATDYHDYAEPEDPAPQPPEITLDGLNLAAIGKIDQASYDDWVFVYVLLDHGTPFYVGSTANPTLRMIAHLQETTHDSAPRIRQMKQRGETPSMRILDITTRQDRYVLEGHWISAHDGLVNSSRYHDHARRYQNCPRCYRAASTSTLQGPIETPPNGR